MHTVSLLVVVAVLVPSLLILACIVLLIMLLMRRPRPDLSRVCMTRDEYHTLITTDHTHSTAMGDQVDTRDRRVLSDPMYPPLDRSSSTVLPWTAGVRTRAPGQDDTYRIIGYLSNGDADKDIGGNTWKLFARQTDSSLATFYIVPSNNTVDVKIMLDNDIVVGRTLRDIYSVPDTLTFTSPLLLRTPYQVVRLPMSSPARDGPYV